MDRSDVVWPTILDFERLDVLAETMHSSFVAADPFPHIVIDNFISAAWLDVFLNEIPDYRSYKRQMDVWGELEDGRAAQFKKDYLSMEIRVGRFTRQLYWELNSYEFLSFLERLTGIQNLLPDPYLVGGGIHETRRDGYLLLHADFNKQRETGLDRRLNIIIYLNKNWQLSFGGDLELWSRDQSKKVSSILPDAGRAVIFVTESDTWHGHPEPVACSDDNTRKSFALYYYTRKRDGIEVAEHQTLWFTPDDNCA